MRPPALPLLLCLCASLLALTGCGGKSAAPHPASLPAAALPSPADLPLAPAARAAAYSEADLTEPGSGFDSTLPSANVAPNAALADFSPDFGPGSPLGDSAYAIYRFSLVGYDRNPAIGQEWSPPPPEGQLWLGLSDWTQNRWKWQNADPASPLELPALAPYIRADGTLLVAVLVLGDQPCTLDSLRIGSKPPVASLLLSPASGMAPLLVAADASGSSDPDGSIAGYEWDLDGNGSFEVSGSETSKNIAINSPSALTISLRVTDNDGVKATRSATARAFTEWQHSWGGGSLEYINGCVYDGADAIYCAGSTSSFGAGSSDVILLKYGLTGSLIWAKTWGTASTDLAGGIAVDPEGNLLVGGTTFDGASLYLLAKFSPDGEALWARSYDFSSYNLYANGFQLYAGRLYLCGYGDGSALPGSYDEGVVLCTDLEGQAQWARAWSEPLNDCTINAVQARAKLFTGPSVYLAGASGDNMLYLRTAEDGSLADSSFWNSGGTDVAYDILVTGLTTHEVYLAGSAAVAGEPGTRGAALVQYSAASPLQRIWYSSQADNALGLAATADGFILAGSAGGVFPTGGLLLGYTAAGALYYAETLQKGDSNYNFGGGVENLAGAALLACGSCGKTQGSNWLPRSGTSTTPAYVWQAANGSWEARAIVNATVTGVMSDPASAVEDSGGGGMSDCLVAVRALP